jgi:DNA-binding NarL/FixJ family response regulator
MNAKRPAVIVVEEQPTLRAAMKKVLETDGFVVNAEADNAEEGLRLVRKRKPDICLVGLRQDEASLRLIASITDEQRGPGTLVIVLTASRSTESMLAAIRAGASGYLLKEMNPKRIPAALRGVLKGEAAMPRTLVVRLIREIQRKGGPTINAKGGLVEFTLRQWEIFHLMSDGLSTAEIATRLLISPVTVRRHVSAIITKLGVPDRASAIELLRESA